MERKVNRKTAMKDYILDVKAEFEQSICLTPILVKPNQQ